MNRPSRQEVANQNRIAAGLPVLYCPNCGRPAAHWEPDQLDDYGRIAPGYYTCEDKS